MGFDFTVAAEVPKGPDDRHLHVDVPKAIASMPVRGPWTHLGGFPLDAVSAQSVEFHRERAQFHLDKLESMRSDLERASNERTCKAMPGPGLSKPPGGLATELATGDPSKASASKT